MTLLQAYLQSPKARRALSKRPGDQGFSLIELVVVVAILAILAAIALPNFLGVSKDGQIAAAKNTLATIIKECAVKDTRYGNSNYGEAGQTGSLGAVQSATANLNGYEIRASGNATGAKALSTIDLTTAGAGDTILTCYGATAIQPTAPYTMPIFSVEFDPATGDTSKTCEAPAAGGYFEGCFQAGTTTVQSTPGQAGEW